MAVGVRYPGATRYGRDLQYEWKYGLEPFEETGEDESFVCSLRAREATSSQRSPDLDQQPTSHRCTRMDHWLRPTIEPGSPEWTIG